AGGSLVGRPPGRGRAGTGSWLAAVAPSGGGRVHRLPRPRRPPAAPGSELGDDPPHQQREPRVEARGAQHDGSELEGRHGSIVPVARRSDGAPTAIARPASQPVVHAAWKLKPPVTPSTSRTSPARWRPGRTRLSMVAKST